MGLEIEYLYSLTPRQFNNVVRGYTKREEIREMGEWERARQIAYISAIFSGNAKKNLRPIDLMKFAWDESKDTMSVAERLKWQEEWNERFEKLVPRKKK